MNNYETIINFIDKLIEKASTSNNNFVERTQDDELITIKFISVNNEKLNIIIVFWKNRYKRVSIQIGLYEEKYYFEIYDNQPDDLLLENEVKSVIYNLLSYESYIFLYKIKEQLIKQIYKYKYLNKENFETDVFIKKYFIFPWEKKHISELQFTLSPWLGF